MALVDFDYSSATIAPVATMTMDASNLIRALRVLLDGYTKRAPAVAVNTACLMIASFAYSKMPVVEQERIDLDMEVQTVPRTLKSGKPSKSWRGSQVVSTKPVTMAMMIVLARMHPFSKYSVMTGNYWPVQRPRSRGLVDFWQRIEVIASRMVKARHSSTGFLKIGWIPAQRELEAVADPKVVRMRQERREYRTAKIPEGIGWARPAKEGNAMAECEIANAVGCGGLNYRMDYNHNKALHEIGGPLLQEAVQEEAQHTVNRVMAVMLQDQNAILRRYGLEIDAPIG